ncbi:C2H2 finger domain-containing protein [Colletotrichum kahawae]|uniref:C2H2 finger domain-containing protein n=1 Tax=Colletotrichum kahawae TaxID=34407 RepID=A0AAE0D6W9_COLKA|nr:C2H2 finger domain-containing protein [Colletotrichum kahawae]
MGAALPVEPIPRSIRSQSQTITTRSIIPSRLPNHFLLWRSADDEKGDSSSDATDIDDLCDDDVDVEDQIRLFDGNLQSSEYWRHKVEAFTEDPFACQDYSPGTTVLLDAVEE